MNIIDFRARPTTKEFEYVQTNPAMIDEFERMGFKPKPLGSIEDFIATLDAAGVTQAVVPARDAETNWGEKVSNDDLAGIVAQYPDRIIGFAGADPLKGRAAVEEIDRAIRELGLSGVSLDPCFAFMAPNDRRLYPLYEKCIELNVPVILTIGPLPIKPLRMEHGDPMTVDALATDLPDLDIVCSHGGWPWTQQMIAIAMRHDNVWFENAGYHTMPGAEMLVQAANTLIPDRMLFATAFPGGQCDSLKEEVEQFRGLGFEPDVLRKVFHDNAKALLTRA